MKRLIIPFIAILLSACCSCAKVSSSTNKTVLAMEEALPELQALDHKKYLNVKAKPAVGAKDGSVLTIDFSYVESDYPGQLYLPKNLIDLKVAKIIVSKSAVVFQKASFAKPPPVILFSDEIPAGTTYSKIENGVWKAYGDW